MEQSLYHFMEQYTSEMFEEQVELRSTPRGTLKRLRHKKSRNLYILRSCRDNIDVWQKLKRIRSQHLPVIYEAAESEESGQILVLEEFIPGDTLESVLTAGPVEPSYAKKITLQICEGLYALHRAGLVHRDIKPENVMLRGDQAVLIDFDASREICPDQDTDTHILGTVGYAAPEQFGFSQTDPRSDIYALGVLLNMMLVREHPSTRLAKGHFGRVVKRCTMVSPDDRFPDVSALMRAL